MATAIIPEWSLGDRLRKSRDYAAISTDDMAKLMGVAPQTVNAWERDFRFPSKAFARFRKWAELCGVDYDWLLTGRGLNAQGETIFCPPDYAHAA